MSKESASYISEYYEQIKDKYPHLSEKQITEVCRSNFKMIKSEMQKGSLRTIRLKYIGIFTVFKGRALGLLNRTRKMYKKEKIKKPTLDYITCIVKNYLKREYDEDLPSEEVSET